MTKRLNIEKGTRFGILTVIKEVEPYRSKWGNFRQFMCQCDCGIKTSWVKIILNTTRTDAFIEKACKFLKDKGSAYITIIDGQLILRKCVVNDFKKYMKGEGV